MFNGDDAPLLAFGYLSTPTTAFTDRLLSDLLIAVRVFNRPRQVSGKLIVLEEDERVVQFAQWIEGPRASIELCIQRIYADTRHGTIEVQWHAEVDRRRFAGWDMAYAAYEPSEWREAMPNLVDQ